METNIHLDEVNEIKKSIDFVYKEIEKNNLMKFSVKQISIFLASTTLKNSAVKKKPIYKYLVDYEKKSNKTMFDYFNFLFFLFSYEDLEKKEYNSVDMVKGRSFNEVKNISEGIYVLEKLIIKISKRKTISENVYNYYYEKVCKELCRLGNLTIRLDREKNAISDDYCLYDKQKNRCFELLDSIDKIYIKTNKKPPQNNDRLKSFIWD